MQAAGLVMLVVPGNLHLQQLNTGRVLGGEVWEEAAAWPPGGSPTGRSISGRVLESPRGAGASRDLQRGGSGPIMAVGGTGDQGTLGRSAEAMSLVQMVRLSTSRPTADPVLKAWGWHSRPGRGPEGHPDYRTGRGAVGAAGGNRGVHVCQLGGQLVPPWEDPALG